MVWICYPEVYWTKLLVLWSKNQIKNICNICLKYDIFTPPPISKNVIISISACLTLDLFRQAENGMYVRMALLAMVLGKC